MNLKQRVLRTGLKTIEYVFKNVTWRMRTGPAPGMRRRYGPGLLPRTLKPTIEERFLYSLDLKGATIYDVGGYVGLYALYFSRAVGDQGIVYTFEPNPHNHLELTTNLRLNGITNVRPLQFGVSAEPGETWFQLDPISPACGHVSNQRPRRGFKVQLESLDHVQERLELPAPDFIKIDVEGHEHPVLDGTRRLLETYHPEMLVEIHGYLTEALVKDLQGYGYHIWQMEGNVDLTEHQGQPPKLFNGHLFCTMADKRNWRSFRGVV